VGNGNGCNALMRGPRMPRRGDLFNGGCRDDSGPAGGTPAVHKIRGIYLMEAVGTTAVQPVENQRYRRIVQWYRRIVQRYRRIVQRYRRIVQWYRRIVQWYRKIVQRYRRIVQRYRRIVQWYRKE